MDKFKNLLEECKEFVADDPIYYGLELSTKDVAIVVEALEKQIPKKVTFRSEYLCGNCTVTINSEDCYCYNCGQRQDWE